MLTRRRFTGYGLAAMTAPPLSYAAQQDTQLYIAQAALVTARVPAAWTVEAGIGATITAIGDDTNFFDAIPFRADSPAAFAAGQTNSAGTPVATPETISWRGHEAIRFAADGVSVLVMENPNPIFIRDGQANTLLFMGSAETFDQILDTVEFGLENVSASQLATAFLDTLKGHSYFRDQVDWPPLYDDASSITDQVEIPNFLIRRVLPALRAGGDYHGSVFDFAKEWATGTPTLFGIDEMFPTGMQIGTSGYLAFPTNAGLSEKYGTQYVQRSCDIRDQLLANGVDSWIIDLRPMGGGDVPTLLTPLYPFLPDGRLAGMIDVAGDVTWTVKEGERITPSLYKHDMPDLSWPTELADPAVPVAVLTGYGTLSAGEYGLLALSSRESLATFGIPTGGLTTIIAEARFASGVSLTFAGTAMLSNDGTAYTSAITPDFSFPEIGQVTMTDETLFAPVFDWLDENKG